MGDLIPLFPVQAKERSCADCQHALFGRSGVYCRVHHIDVWDEVAEAEECEDWST
jgi:hypothetical protein